MKRDRDVLRWRGDAADLAVLVSITVTGFALGVVERFLGRRVATLLEGAARRITTVLV